MSFGTIGSNRKAPHSLSHIVAHRCMVWRRGHRCFRYADMTVRVEDLDLTTLCAVASLPCKVHHLRLTPHQSLAHSVYQRTVSRSSSSQVSSLPLTPRHSSQMLSVVSTKTNSHEYMSGLERVRWSQLTEISPVMTSRAKELAISYGYSVVDDP